ncbi:duf614 domain containing protein [Grosmannia clavigera kw1407]|uniref:Duf614 domain containing protein n=1 Tax=Grosmannia clavigera (strain kw1407 / UAMH 11150) TaxID=655863 RepID=F0XNX9_GROCL|nr:duf614 domain containing protein [Grosmannia clavigera kw1407]EFX00261.1 duf614 domain containing protein [Grosmannia clavigera kw1407]
MSSGPVNDKDVEEWKARINNILAKPTDHINQRSPDDSQPWYTSFFDCCSPIDLCLTSWCLPCVTFGKTHHRLRKDVKLEGYEPINTSCLFMCGAGCIGLHWIPLSMQRADIREKYNLQGNCIVDIAAACCCGLCDLVQQEKEVSRRGNLQQDAVKQQYQSNNEMAYPGAAAPK